MIEFWKKINKIQGKKEKTNVHINDLKEEFYKQFNHKLFQNPDTKIISDMSYEKFMEETKDKVFHEYNVNYKNLKKIIKDISNGKSTGFAGVQPEMYKYGLSNRLLTIIGLIIQTMIKFSITPYHFNIGIIKPIVKDDKKEPNDLNNLRPVTISDTLANIYEKIIFSEIELTHTNDEKQFGF